MEDALVEYIIRKKDGKFVKGEYNQYYHEIYFDDEYIGDVRAEHIDIFINLLNKFYEQNQLFKQFGSKMLKYFDENNEHYQNYFYDDYKNK